MNSRSKSGLFLIELIIVITVFSISAAVCLRLFFQSRVIANESYNLSRASLEVQSAADCYKSSGGDLAETADRLGGSLLDGKLMIYYDEKWGKTEDRDDAGFFVGISEISDLESIVCAQALGGGEIFSVSVRGGMNLG